MRAGNLRHRIVIQQLTRTADGQGGYTESWATFATVWAAVEPLKGRELFAAQQTQAETSHKIRIRYLAGVTQAMRVLFGNRTFVIDSIINVDERNRELILMCKEG